MSLSYDERGDRREKHSAMTIFCFEKVIKASLPSKKKERTEKGLGELDKKG